jgi:hypothetical protein
MVFVKINTDGAASALLGCNSDFEGQMMCENYCGG